MQKSRENDMLRLTGIIKSINNIKKCFDDYKIESPNHLKIEVIAQAACTQFITNIYENKNKLSDETYLELPLFNKIKLASARHIASHDYDNVNFVVIHKICILLTQETILSEIQDTINKIERELANEPN